MFYCYVWRSQKTGRRYVGSCENVTEPICRHNAGDSKAAKHGTSWVLVHSEGFASRSEAAQRERYYKTGRGRDDLDKAVVERSPRRQVGGSNPFAPTFDRIKRRTPNWGPSAFPPRAPIRRAGSHNPRLDRAQFVPHRNISPRDAKNKVRSRSNRDASQTIRSA